MSNTNAKTFHYHADASAIGGFINRPFQGFIPSHTSLSLPIVGGFVQKERKRARSWKDIVNFSSESTHVSGSKRHELEDGPWTTQVSATVNDLNILDVVTAKKVVAQLSVSHPHDGGQPTISVVGSQFEDLRISNFKIEPVIRYDLFAQHDGVAPVIDPNDPAMKRRDRTAYPQKPWPRQEKFLDKVKEQFRLAKEAYTERYGEKKVPDWMEHHFSAFDSSEGLDGRDYIACSLIDHLPALPPNFPGVVCKHGIHIPEFGRIFFGELHVDQGVYRISMIRVQLGCPVEGASSVCTASSNGRPGEPSKGGGR